ncbi:orotidine-5'-phosphate decarboxylase [Haladaptatus sp. F3-133]|uniref:Orotidine 5'-phosphate decarboxylase n=1 Tax=Halorutilus salinus TaxID=2487751 RepID=A0A9Q4GGI8_9EURY|nr:orotidine-5'-phosphate decarboxylase [Halorutilus salinus]MCX2819199.1 orotidine-5'-phosphate decarboxylase [Halorutilus salinus]
MSFFDRLGDGIEKKDSLVCVGLDPVPSRIPDGVGVAEFNRRIIDATSDVAVAYKPNTAFYEALGTDGWGALLETVEEASAAAPVILDAKRGDIGHSSRRYAELLDVADAITVSPYMGTDSVRPFIEDGDAGVFVLCKTTNQGSSEFQELDAGGKPVYAHVAERAVDWNAVNGNVGLVVGATDPEEMENVREHAGDLPFLVPGIGAQGGDAEAAVEYGTDPRGVGVVNSTRSIIYAGDGDGFEEAARESARSLRKTLNGYR